MDLQNSPPTPFYASGNKKSSLKQRFLTFLLFLTLLTAASAFAYLWIKERDTANVLRGELTQLKQEIARSKVSGNAIDTTDSKYTKYVSSEGKFSLRYPSSWVTAENQDQCSAQLLLGANIASVGRCGSSDEPGQMSVSSSEGDSTTEQMLSKDDFSNLSTASATTNGVKEIKQVGTASGQADTSEYKDGTEVVRYLFFENNRTYVATYLQKDNYPDVLDEFERMIEETFEAKS